MSTQEPPLPYLAMAGLALLAAACGPDLHLPAGTTIRCARSAECPQPLACDPKILRCVKPDAIIADNEAPRLLSAAALDESVIRSVFSEALEEASAVDLGCYRLVDGATMLVVALERAAFETPDNLQVVILESARQRPGAPYELTATCVEDLGHNPVDPDHQTVVFQAQLPDTEAPMVLTPTDGQLVVRADHVVTLGWTPRRLATSYEVEVFADEALTTPLPGFSWPYVTAETSWAMPLLADDTAERTYWWRVRADVSEPGSHSPVARFGLVDDTIYVDADAAAALPASAAMGTRNRPLASIGVALAYAAIRPDAIAAVKVARRAADAAYYGSVTVVPGVSLLGGYAGDFESRDVTTGRTRVSGSGIATVAAVAVTMDAPVVIEGFTFDSGAVGNNVGMQVAGCDSGLTVASCTITGGDDTRESFGVLLVASGATAGAGPLFENVVISAGRVDDPLFGQLTAGVFVDDSSPTFRDASVTSGPTIGNESLGVQCKSGQPTFLTSQISGGDGGNAATSIGLGVFGLCHARLHRSLVVGGTVNGGMSVAVYNYRGGLAATSSIFIAGDAGPGGIAHALRWQTSATPSHITNCTLVGPSRGAYLPCALLRETGAGGYLLSVTNSILLTNGTMGMCESTPAATIGSFENNLLTGSSELFAEKVTSGGNCSRSTVHDCYSLEADLNDHGLICKNGFVAGADTASGNLGIETVADVAAVQLADAAAGDYHLTAATPAAIKTGGKNVGPGVTTCGDQLDLTCGDVSEDYDGNPRPGADGLFAIGAFEPP
ncbi:MAG: hypothetical protein HY903_09115 [Deltaproteobacteria bacterium]|nr:hypothetical protein [Deltaproteobacteria bacterium]